MAEGPSIQVLAASQAFRSFVQTGRTTGQVESPRVISPPVLIGRTEAAPLRPRVQPPVRIEPSELKPLPRNNAEAPQPALDRLLQARARAAGIPERAPRGEDLVFAQRVAADSEARVQAVLSALNQRALAVTLGPSGRLSAPAGIQSSLLDSAR